MKMASEIKSENITSEIIISETTSDITRTSVENNKNNISFFNKCRLCLDKEGFAVISSLNNLSNNIYTLIGIMIKDTDSLPTKICNRCFEIIVDFIDLSSKATKNEEYLRSLFGNSSIEEKSTDSTSNIEEDMDDLITNDYAQNSNATFLSVRKDLYLQQSPSKSIKVENSPKQIKPKDKDREWKCNICLKIFSTRRQHTMHQRSHNKIFSCPIDICGKKFATKGDLEKHLRSHTGEKPFQCDECDKAFTQKVTLRAHKISLHNMAT